MDTKTNKSKSFLKMRYKDVELEANGLPAFIISLGIILSPAVTMLTKLALS